jgi:hypothetical protein
MEYLGSSVTSLSIESCSVGRVRGAPLAGKRKRKKKICYKREQMVEGEGEGVSSIPSSQ